MTSIHLLTEQKADIYKTGCGQEVKSKFLPPDITAWSGDLTCPFCVTRLFVVHAPIKNLVELMNVANLDDTTVAKKFHFTGKRFGFRWLIGKPVLYVYETPEGFSPMMALPIQNLVDIRGRDCTYPDAQMAAREWIIHHEHNFSAPSKAKKRVVQTAPIKPKIPAGYEGPLCKACGKHDEGDFMPHPDSMLDQLCMTCLVSGKR